MIPSPTTNDLYAVSFADSMVGTAVGANGTIIRTTDGGLHWFLQSSDFQKTLHDMKMTDALTAIAVGDSATILRSTDGGVIWEQRPRTYTNDLYSVEIIHKDTGWIGSSSILHTTDGWTTWALQSPGNLGARYISCINSRICMATGGNFIKTIDGGETWTTLNRNYDGIGALQMYDTASALAVGVGFHSGAVY